MVRTTKNGTRITIHIWPIIWNVAAITFALTGHFAAAFVCAMVAQVQLEWS